jgi:hypothetical protein
MIDAQRCFCKNDQLVCRQTPQGAWVFDPYRRRAINLNPVAAGIWQLIDGRRRVADIIEALAQAYDADPSTLRRDAYRLFQELLRREMIL